MLLWPSRTDTRSSGTPGNNRSTANVSRNRCGCPWSTRANLKTFRMQLHQCAITVFGFDLPVQKKYASPGRRIRSSAWMTTGGSGQCTGVPAFEVYRKSGSHGMTFMPWVRNAQAEKAHGTQTVPWLPAQQASLSGFSLPAVNCPIIDWIGPAFHASLPV